MPWRETTHARCPCFHSRSIILRQTAGATVSRFLLFPSFLCRQPLWLGTIPTAMPPPRCDHLPPAGTTRAFACATRGLPQLAWIMETRETATLDASRRSRQDAAAAADKVADFVRSVRMCLREPKVSWDDQAEQPPLDPTHALFLFLVIPWSVRPFCFILFSLPTC